MAAQVVGSGQSANSCGQGEGNGETVILLQVTGHIPGCGGRKHQQGIQDQKAHAGNAQGDNHRDGYGEYGCAQLYRNAPGGGQLGMDHRQGQPVGEQDPEEEYCEQNQCQSADFTGGDGENVADEVSVVFCEAAAAQGGDENAQGHGSAGEYTDDGIRCLVAAAANPGEQECERDAEEYCCGGRHGDTENAADGNARKGGMTQSV